MTHPIPVILDTDIGGDIDDTWALALLLKSPELDLKLVVSDTGDTRYRARVAARLLEVAGRTDVPVGIGLPPAATGGSAADGGSAAAADDGNPQAPWVAGYTLADYPGTIVEDGVGALIDTIMASPEPVTLICIGPVPNIAAALQREPRIAQNARFVGMHGSIRVGYGGSSVVSAEYNVVADPAACRTAFEAPWEVTITPLDTCGLVQLKGAHYAAVRDSRDPLARAVIENYRIWAPRVKWPEADNVPDIQSSTLFDTVAVTLAFSEAFMEMETLPLRVTDDGYTTIDPAGKPVRCATRWTDLAGFEAFLAARLSGVGEPA